MFTHPLFSFIHKLQLPVLAVLCTGKLPQEMMNSDMMEEVLGNPEKMEQARQAILENPTLKQAMTQLPGFSDMVSEPAPPQRARGTVGFWGEGFASGAHLCCGPCRKYFVVQC